MLRNLWSWRGRCIMPAVTWGLKVWGSYADLVRITLRMLLLEKSNDTYKSFHLEFSVFMWSKKGNKYFYDSLTLTVNGALLWMGHIYTLYWIGVCISPIGYFMHYVKLEGHDLQLNCNWKTLDLQVGRLQCPYNLLHQKHGSTKKFRINSKYLCKLLIVWS